MRAVIKSAYEIQNGFSPSSLDLRLIMMRPPIIVRYLFVPISASVASSSSMPSRSRAVALES